MLVTLAALACSSEESGFPYAFDLRPAQSFVLEGRERVQVGDAPVAVERLAQFELRAEPRDAGGLVLDARLDRYYLSVRGGPDGDSELAISAEGLISRGEPHGELRLGPEAELLSGAKLGAALRRPIASQALDARGRSKGSLWQTEEPVLVHARVLDWWLLAAPPLSPDATTWTGEREVPELGQYRLGIPLPLHYARESPAATGEPIRISASGVVSRRRLALRPGFEGALTLDLSGDLRLFADAALERATLLLRMRFESTEGEIVQSEQRMSVRCATCPRDLEF